MEMELGISSCPPLLSICKFLMGKVEKATRLNIIIEEVGPGQRKSIRRAGQVYDSLMLFWIQNTFLPNNEATRAQLGSVTFQEFSFLFISLGSVTFQESNFIFISFTDASQLWTLDDIAIKYHLLLENKNEEVQLNYCKSDERVLDILKNIIASAKFQHLRVALKFQEKHTIINMHLKLNNPMVVKVDKYMAESLTISFEQCNSI